jgi:hypothetical protein
VTTHSPARYHGRTGRHPSSSPFSPDLRAVGLLSDLSAQIAALNLALADQAVARALLDDADREVSIARHQIALTRAAIGVFTGAPSA